MTSLDECLSKFQKKIVPVARNGLCILESFKVAFEAAGYHIISDLKELLRNEISTNYEFDLNFSDHSVNIVEEVENVLKDPEKLYANDTVDRFLQALARTLSITGKIFKINSDGITSDIDIGVHVASSDIQCYFARTDICHVDPILDFKSENTTNITAHNSTEVCYIDISDGECDIEDSQQLFSRVDVNVESDSIDKMFATGIVDDICYSSVDVDFETRPLMEDRNNSVKESILDDFSYENPSTEKLLQIILNSPEILEETLPVKGIRRNLCYTIKGHRIEDITADDNGAYINCRKLFFVENNVNIKLNTRTVHEHNGEYCYKERVGRLYKEAQVSRKDVYTIEKYYRRNKSIPDLKMLIVRVKLVTETEFKPYVCVTHHRTKSDSGEEDSIQILPHGNTKNKHKDNPYIRTSKTT